MTMTKRAKWAGRVGLAAIVAAAVLPAGAGGADITDEDVIQAIEKGKAYLEKQLKGGIGGGNKGQGEKMLALMTLAYMGMHPNREVMGEGLDYMLGLDPDADIPWRRGYIVPIRSMALTYLHDDSPSSGDE